MKAKNENDFDSGGRSWIKMTNFNNLDILSFVFPLKSYFFHVFET